MAEQARVFGESNACTPHPAAENAEQVKKGHLWWTLVSKEYLYGKMAK